MTSQGNGRRGRPLSPLDPDASSAARLGAELRACRLECGLTLQALAARISYAPQYISEIERAKTPPTRLFIEACDRALDAGGVLLALLPAATHERERHRQERAAARRAERDPSLPCETYSDAGDEDVDPTNRRGVLGAGAGAALGLSIAAAPTQARQIDPELPSHWAGMLLVLGRHDNVFGPKDVLGPVRREVSIIAAHRKVATGELRTELMRVEARWADFVARLSEDTGDLRSRDAWTDRALRLAEATDYPEMIAFAHSRQSEWAVQEHNAQRVIAFAQAGLSVPGASAQTRAWCALQAALGYALAIDVASCERWLADAYNLLGDESPLSVNVA